MSVRCIPISDIYAQSFAIGTQIISINVGRSKTKFLVHESILQHNVWFRACLNSGMVEQERKAIDLPDDYPEDFAIVVQWMYMKTIPSTLVAISALSAWILADKFRMHDLQNKLLDHYRAKNYELDADDGMGTVYVADPKILYDFWGQTLDASPLRQLGLDYMHYFLTQHPRQYRSSLGGKMEDDVRKMLSDPEIAYELMLKFANHGQQEVVNPCTLTGCVYHVHPDGRQCQ